MDVNWSAEAVILLGPKLQDNDWTHAGRAQI